MKQIGQIMPKVLAKRGLNAQAEAAHVTTIVRVWLTKELPVCCEYIEVASLKDGTLYLKATNSIVAQECHQKSDILLEFLKIEFPNKQIEAISIVRT